MRLPGIAGAPPGETQTSHLAAATPALPLECCQRYLLPMWTPIKPLERHCHCLEGSCKNCIMNFSREIIVKLGASQVLLWVKNFPASAGDTGDAGSIPVLGRSSGIGNGNPLQYSCLESSMDRGSWWATVHEVAKSQTRLSTHTLRLNERDLISFQLYACSETGTLEPGIK